MTVYHFNQLQPLFNRPFCLMSYLLTQQARLHGPSKMAHVQFPSPWITRCLHGSVYITYSHNLVLSMSFKFFIATIKTNKQTNKQNKQKREKKKSSLIPIIIMQLYTTEEPPQTKKMKPKKQQKNKQKTHTHIHKKKKKKKSKKNNNNNK